MKLKTFAKKQQDREKQVNRIAAAAACQHESNASLNQIPRCFPFLKLPFADDKNDIHVKKEYMFCE